MLRRVFEGDEDQTWADFCVCVSSSSSRGQVSHTHHTHSLLLQCVKLPHHSTHFLLQALGPDQCKPPDSPLRVQPGADVAIPAELNLSTPFSQVTCTEETHLDLILLFYVCSEFGQIE